MDKIYDYAVKIYGTEQEFELSFDKIPTVQMIREDIQSTYPNFTFVKKNQKQLFKGSEKRTNITEIIHPNNTIIIKLPQLSQQKKNNKTSTSNQIQKVQQQILQAIVVESSFNFRQKITFTKTDKLSDIRQLITIDSKYQNFSFLESNSSDIQNINKGSESKMLAHKIIKDGKIIIKFISKNAEQITLEKNQNKEKQLQKAFQTKDKIKGLLNQLTQFQNGYRQQNDAKNQAKMNKLRQVQDKLQSLKIECKFQKGININQVIKQLTSIKEQSEQFITHLQNITNHSDQELLTKFSNNICVGYFKEEKVNSNIFDLQSSKLLYDSSFNELKSRYFTYSSDSQYFEHKSSLDSMLNGGSIAAMGGSPFFFVQGGADYHQDSQSTKINDKSSKKTQFINHIFAVYVGLGAKFNLDNLVVSKQIISLYQQLHRNFIALKATDFFQKCKVFFSRYGSQVQTGTYYMGNKFSSKLKVKFFSQTSMQKMSTISRRQLDISISGGGLFSGGFFAAKGSFSHRSTQANELEIQRKQQKYQTTKEKDTHPPVENINTWTEIISLNNNYWKILSKSAENISILDFFRTKNTLQNSPYLSNLSSQQFNRFQKKLKQIIKTLQSGIGKGSQAGFIQIEEPNLNDLTDKLNEVQYEQFANTKKIVLMQTSKDVTITLLSILQVKVLLLRCKFASNTGLLSTNQFIKSNSVIIKAYELSYSREVNLSNKIRCKSFYEQGRNKYIMQDQFTKALRQFKNLRYFTFYITFPLMNFASSHDLAELLNSMKLDEINIIVHPFYKEYQTEKNWTNGLKCNDNKKAKITFKDWN